MPIAIEAEGLVKRFGKNTALAGVDLTAEEGTVLGMLGPNGAGKTTAVRILATLTRPDGGAARVGGYDIVRQAHEVRQLIGLTGQFAAVDENLSGRENLYLIGGLLGFSGREARRRADDLLERFGLADAATKRARAYSGGMRRRLDLAASLVGHPRILYLDEPTTGLDPQSRLELWEIVGGLVREGTTVLLTTQYLDEVDRLAGDIVVIDHGRVIAAGTSRELKARTGSQILEVGCAVPTMRPRVERVLRELVGATPREDPGTHLFTLPVTDPAVLPEAVRRLDAAGVVISALALRMPSLDEVFLQLTGTRPAGTSGGDATADRPDVHVPKEVPA
ncbi:MAG: ATP-binding cassette domain-containing protein [Candidatus Dormibacteraeota bacterium]|nr:ATP-binding cassette domain-containing protein [Candidatus Dormibacteraeota bacterium]MBO0743662.1 ATP-binding cassette domain-containing protein [Candidatus Dormibacteraeota bacterium]